MEYCRCFTVAARQVGGIVPTSKAAWQSVRSVLIHLDCFRSHRRLPQPWQIDVRYIHRLETGDLETGANQSFSTRLRCVLRYHLVAKVVSSLVTLRAGVRLK